MAIPLYLAMTAAEFSAGKKLPQYPAWMSCHFSPAGKGLSNLPPALPVGSLLILDDQMPPDEHDAALIRQQLEVIIESSSCAGLLLDFQRPDDSETDLMVRELLRLPCPVCVSHWYAKELSCPVLLPPCPLITPLAAHLAPWDGREIWLEAATDSAGFTVTSSGCQLSYFPGTDCFPHEENALHCSYRIEKDSDEIRFHLHRGPAHIPALLLEAEKLGVSCAVGLRQELEP